MAAIRAKTAVHFELSLTLNEREARALHGLTEYGAQQFLDVFYKQLGRAVLEPHDGGLRSLFKTIGDALPPELERIDAARADIAGRL